MSMRKREVGEDGSRRGGAAEVEQQGSRRSFVAAGAMMGMRNQNGRGER
jgi:hypothetical protein